ncbi:Diacylglycerol kinase family enzyme [Arthrobacter sp. 49Tsu3.1M3]|jgi:diacylglycerol kinase family enzyme|uniref:diacylglycerol/lipid kinase family protein n=1 Tax=Arthrobacter sp. 49Tsu3.1M3 TaxID=1279029 RepID=UPI0009A77FED|nr:diacylglycerol kinase family protein [Arthrobacter sp. 49Tsu3.1M3]SKB89192.1 Diacylglycerol kinase family enzyme [Arthrobacter sp. 49Tsu3.1M3]
MTVIPFDEVPQTRRWWARAAYAAVVCAALVPLVAAGLAGTIALLLTGAGGLVVTVAGIYWFLISRGVMRWCALGLAILAPLVVLVLFIQAGLLREVIITLALGFVALVCARAALRERGEGKAMAEHPAPAWRHAFLVMNPRSGGGKVVKFDLQRKAEELGAEVALLEGPGQVDVDALARQAVERGADLLGVAGGDGTQALVAGIAAEHNLPFLVISAGTRNHFALDLGLDREDPTGCLDALRDGTELHVDLGKINGRTFVNNASFGVYAEVVQSPEYRGDKAGTVLEMLPDLIRGDKGARLRAQMDGITVDGPQAVLVSNGPYGSNDVAGLGRRTRLDRGVLGAVTISAASTREAVGLLRRATKHGLIQRTAAEVVVGADVPEIPVGVDGEALIMTTPVRCTIEPHALRVLVPRKRPGVPPAQPALDLVRLRELAWGRHVSAPPAPPEPSVPPSAVPPPAGGGS